MFAKRGIFLFSVVREVDSNIIDANMLEVPYYIFSLWALVTELSTYLLGHIPHSHQTGAVKAVAAIGSLIWVTGAPRKGYTE